MKDIEIAYARAFLSESGSIVIKHLRKMTLERTLGPNASESELRTLEGQRALVQHIEQMILRGKSNAKT
ncbi:MAG: hypothetical protein K5912_03750 [Alphaproteobacteria bacterium]|nr:hypothetical protein [Alphaproteobacteria bacterium]